MRTAAGVPQAADAASGAVAAGLDDLLHVRVEGAEGIGEADC